MHKNGLEPYLDTLLNTSELRNDCNIIITKCSAKDYISNVDPALENQVARYYESSVNSAKHTGYATNVTLFEFYTKMKDSFSQAYTVLGTTTVEDSENSDVETNGNYIAGQNPISDKDKIENMGLAVFNNDKLIGELTGLDTICHLIIKNDIHSCVMSVPSPNDNNSYIDILLTSEKNTQCGVLYENNVPNITVNIHLIAQGLSLDNTADYSTDEELLKIENEASNYIKAQVLNYLYKTSHVLNSDICGFGKYTLKNYKTIQEWENSKWLENYKNANFNVNVHLKLKSGNLFNKS